MQTSAREYGGVSYPIIERKEDKIRFLTLRGLACKCCFVALFLHLLDRKSLVDNDGGVYNA